MTTVLQLVPRFEPGAVGAALIEGREALRVAGHRSEIVADEIDPRFESFGARSSEHLDAIVDADTVIVYHLAIGAAMAERLLARSEPLVVVYHNLTPAALLEPWDPHLGPAIAWGRHQVRALASRACLAIAMSRFSEGELREAGYANTTTVPVLVSPNALADAPPERVEYLRSSCSGSRWLFVSRIAPHKGHHHLLAAFAVYRQAHDPHASLWLCGGSASDRYLAALRGFVESTGLESCVTFAGSLEPSELAAYYAAAEVFVCLSEHEGFAVPLLEAWSHDLPVVAYSAAAVPETVGDAAVLLHDRSPGPVASAVDRVLRDSELRRALTERGRTRLDAQFGPASVRARFVSAIESVR